MTAPTCPKCLAVLPAEDINVAKDVAYCRACNLAHALSGLVDDEGPATPPDLQRPPAGTWYRPGPVDTVIGASHRSLPAALGSLAVCLFWNGIVSVFVLVALSGTLHNLGVTLPGWFPAPEMNDETMSWGVVLFLWLFLTPFIVIGAGMVLYFLSALAGHTEVRLRQGMGTLFVGIGPLGWTRRFDPALVHTVKLRDKTWRDSDGDARRQRKIHLELQNGKTLEFGSTLREERQHFLVAALRQALRG
jgi:hypothetical protein